MPPGILLTTFLSAAPRALAGKGYLCLTSPPLQLGIAFARFLIAAVASWLLPSSCSTALTTTFTLQGLRMPMCFDCIPCVSMHATGYISYECYQNFEAYSSNHLDPIPENANIWPLPLHMHALLLAERPDTFSAPLHIEVRSCRVSCALKAHG